ncbi:MAG: LacI family DNA-binding transcriptional regulator [Actinomycetaceae bacterium]|nr:LacI family DNA-binding transcriptional regulator [Actinomycetaceae bacterium]
MLPISQPSNKPSIQDVARLAGVSAQTVSRVARQAPNVRESTRDRVLLAMEQLGYVPNRAARALRSGKFRAIGVITQNLMRTGENMITAGIAAAAEERGYSVTLRQVSHPETDDLAKAGAYFSNQSIDGLIIVQAGSGQMPSTLPRNIPTVVSDSRFVDSFPSVAADQVQGTGLIMQHLFDLGHRRIAHIAGPTDSGSANTRQLIWQKYLGKAGLPLGPIAYGDWSARSGYQATIRLLREANFTAIFSANDEMAFGAMRALHDHSLRVPEDVSVAGFDNIALSDFAIPPLTTVTQNFEAIGRALVDLILDEIETPSGEREHLLIPCDLFARQSTGPVNVERR